MSFKLTAKDGASGCVILFLSALTMALNVAWDLFWLWLRLYILWQLCWLPWQ
jgi:hypothetical protein